MPPGCMAKHGNPWRIRAKPYYGGLSDGLLPLPFDHELDHVDVQSCDHDVSAYRSAHVGGVRSLPCEQQLFRNAGDGLLQLPHGGMAEYNHARRISA